MQIAKGTKLSLQVWRQGGTEDCEGQLELCHQTHKVYTQFIAQ